MANLDKQNRLVIPRPLMLASTTDFSKEVRIYVKGNIFFLDNPSMKNRRIPNLGSVKVDCKGRFCIFKSARDFLRIDQSSQIYCYLHEDKVTFKRLLLIPENR